MQIGKVHVVLEHLVVQLLDARSLCDEQILSNPQVLVADIFRRNRQKDSLVTAVRVLTGE